MLAENPAYFELEIDAVISARKIAYEYDLAVVPATMRQTALAAEAFFERRERRSTRAFLSPNLPFAIREVVKPAKR